MLFLDDMELVTRWLGFESDSEAVLGSILDEPHLGVLWPPPCKDFCCYLPVDRAFSARKHRSQRCGQAGEGRNTVQEHGLWEFANPKDIQVGFKLETENNAVWFFGEKMKDLILG